MTADIARHKSQRSVGKTQIIKPVAAGLLGWMRATKYLETLQLRMLSGQEGLLDQASEVEFAIEISPFRYIERDTDRSCHLLFGVVERINFAFK